MRLLFCFVAPWHTVWASLMAQMVKNLPAMQETWVWSLDQEDPVEKERVTHPVFLPREFHGQRSLALYSPWGPRKLDTTELLPLTNRNAKLNTWWCHFYEVKWSHSVVSNSLWPHGLWPTRLLRPWNFPDKSTGVGCHFLLQGIFPTQGSNPGLLHCRQTLYHLSHQGSHFYGWIFMGKLVAWPNQ